MFAYSLDRRQFVGPYDTAELALEAARAAIASSPDPRAARRRFLWVGEVQQLADRGGAAVLADSLLPRDLDAWLEEFLTFQVDATSIPTVDRQALVDAITAHVEAAGWLTGQWRARRVRRFPLARPAPAGP